MYSRIKFLGEEHIDENTDKRIKRKFNEHRKRKRSITEKGLQLEKLFNHKLEIFEIEEIKKSKNRKLKKFVEVNL